MTVGFNVVSSRGILVWRLYEPPLNRSALKHSSLKHLHRQPRTGYLPPLQALGPDPGCMKVTLCLLLVVDSRLPKGEQIMHADDLPFHAGDLRNLDHLARPTREARH